MTSRIHPLLMLAAALAATLAPAARATAGDAQSRALDAAADWSKQGVSIRYDTSRGTTFSGRTVKVSYQVFKGNQYWFFAGGSLDGVQFDIVVRDAGGQMLDGTLTSGRANATYHFTAPRTMLVSVEITGRTNPAEAFDWALVYGFRSKEAEAVPTPPARKD